MLCPVFSFDGTRHDGYYSYMKKAGIAELKNNLSRYLDQVKNGESILVLDRNQPVAQIIPLQKAARGVTEREDRLARLERKGLIRRGSGGSGQWLTKLRLVKVPGSVLQDLLDERRSGW
jgi:prevent-host-death family protein